MKNTLLTCLTLAALMLSGCAVGVGPSPASYTSHYAGPSLVVIPGTYVYVAPDFGADIYFHVGFWWRLSDGFWYRSHHYDRGWSRYHGIPVFYRQIDPGWRSYYAKRQWHGHPWKYERIPAHRVQREWSRWESTRHWEKRNNWGVQGWRATAHRQHVDAAPPARTALRQPDRHQDYRTDRVRREYVDSRPQRLQNDRTQRDHSVRQPHNARDQRPGVGTWPQGGGNLGNRPERRQQDSEQRHTRENVTRQSPVNRPQQEDRRWQAPTDRQGPESRRPQEDRQWQAPTERQGREAVTRQSPESRPPQDDRRWQGSPERQGHETVTRQRPENRPQQEDRRWQAPTDRQGPESRRPQEDRRHRQDGGDSPTALQQPDLENQQFKMQGP